MPGPAQPPIGKLTIPQNLTGEGQQKDQGKPPGRGKGGAAQPAEALDEEKMAMLRKAFIMFDQGKTGKIEKEKIRTILNTLGANYINEELEVLMVDNDVDGTGKLEFDAFARVVGHFLEEQDEEAMQKELKEAFRLYDREGNGFIPIAALKEILGALDDKLSSSDLDSIVEEIDEDGSGTVDFDEFMEMMTGD